MQVFIMEPETYALSLFDVHWFSYAPVFSWSQGNSKNLSTPDCQMPKFSGNHSPLHVKFNALAQQHHYYVFNPEKLEYMYRYCTCVSLKVQPAHSVLGLETEMFTYNGMAAPTHEIEY